MSVSQKAICIVAFALIMSCGMHPTTAEENLGSVSNTSSSSVTAMSLANGSSASVGGESYSTVVIGTQTWFVRNLDLATAVGSSCYQGLDSNCQLYGRLYTLAVAQTLCPSPWHLPSQADWISLINTIQTSSSGSLEANNALWHPNTSTDPYGFSALPGGSGWVVGDSISYGGIGTNATFWTSTADTLLQGEYWTYALIANSSGIGGSAVDPASMHSVRCMK